MVGGTGFRLAIDGAVLPYLPALMCVPLIFSGMLFHQAVWLDAQGAAEWIAVGLAVYAVAQTSSMLISGMLVNRFSARWVVSTYALPAAIGIGIALMGSPEWTVLGYFAGAGFATGALFRLYAASPRRTLWQGNARRCTCNRAVRDPRVLGRLNDWVRTVDRCRLADGCAADGRHGADLRYLAHRHAGLVLIGSVSKPHPRRDAKT